MRIWMMILCIVFFSGVFTTAAGSTYKRQIVVSVGDLQSPDRLQWKKEICARIHLLANQVNDGGVDVVCRQFDTGSFVDKALNGLKNKFSYHIRVLRQRHGDIDIDITNWKRIHETDFQSIGWNFQPHSKEGISPEDAFAKVIANFFFYAANERAFKAGLLAHGASESKYIIYDSKSGVFRESLTNGILTLERAFTLFGNESERKKTYLRTGLELGALLSAGFAIHYKNLVNEIPSSSIQNKWNPNGSLYNSESSPSLEAFLISLSTAAAWDFVEYSDVFSVNTQLINPLSLYLLEEAKTHASCALNWAKEKNPKTKATQCKKNRWTEVSSKLGLERGQKPYNASKQQASLLNLNVEVVNLTDYNKQNQEAKLLIDSVMLKQMTPKGRRHTWRDLKVLAEVVSAAHHKKKMGIEETTDLKSYDLQMAFKSASMTDEERAEQDREEQTIYGQVDFLGASARANVFMNDIQIQVEFGFQGDFAMVKSYALSEVPTAIREGTSQQIGASSKSNYYWGFGTSTLAAISALRGRFKWGYEWRASKASDFQIKELGQVDPYGRTNIEDNTDSQKIYVRYQLIKNLSFQVSVEKLYREGSMSGVASRRGTEARAMGTLQYIF